METQQTNGTTPATTEKAPNCLDLALASFRARKKPPTVQEVTAVVTKYLKADELVKKAEAELEKVKAARTEVTKEIVAVRGMGIVNTKTRGTGRVMARSDSAWIAFSSSDEEQLDI
jgi:hypothetical protein